MSIYICKNCNKEFERYPSMVTNLETICCSKICAIEYRKKTHATSGINNPNYKHGKYCDSSICQCGNIKDVRSSLCSICSNKGYAKIGALERNIDYDLIKQQIPLSISYTDLSKKTNYSRSIVTKFIIKNNLDISHFMTTKGRPVNLKKLFNISDIRNGATLNKYILKYNLLEYKCNQCGITNMYNNKTISLQLHHKDGNRYNNMLNNLEYLCPNCHSQTDTFCGKNNKQYNK